VLLGLRESQLIDRIVIVSSEQAALEIASAAGAEHLDDPDEPGHSAAASAGVTDAIAHGALLVSGDVSDAAAVCRLCAEIRPDRVFHLAAQVDVRASVADPGRDVRVNVEGTVNLLEAARRCGAGGFALASSCAVYGEPENGDLPLAEAAPLRPLSPYGQAKLAAEGYASLYRDLHGLAAVSLRFGNVYGPRQGAVGEAGVVAIFCRELCAGGRPTVFGSGGQTRDFVYVGDVVAALIAAADRAAVGEINVGTGSETTVLELVERIAAAGERPGFLPVMEPQRAGEIERMALDASRARTLLDWDERMTLDDGLRLTLDSNRQRSQATEQAAADGPARPSPTL